MILTRDELEFLSAWGARNGNRRATDCRLTNSNWLTAYQAPQLLVFIKVWTQAEGKKDLEILAAAENPQPRWPWSTPEDFAGRFAEASRCRTH